ncbi:hypothetical protein JQC91_13020 [Jannaschia sp. Os4]|uniref:tetratricopeptide repeat protein n=1 Tax=Jannaschia sp. Os4 TaxID=2807617 RepID=UPI00193A3895|nr:hypothetical protein [Jannaschia sp. Os4]MBM2577223.1 hypothetical protein [Jannaschia sp. Os4]
MTGGRRIWSDGPMWAEHSPARRARAAGDRGSGGPVEGLPPLAVCFTVDASNAFGRDFLLGLGWEVILVRHRPRTWPRHPPPGLAEALRPRLAGRGAVTYGSSQGATAALLYARALGAARVVAISPRASRTVTGGPAGTGRWAEAAPEVDWRYAATPEEVAAPLRVALLYDDANPLDAPIADQIAEAMGDPARLTRVRVPLAGHPAGRFLKETGQLAPVARALLEQAPVPPVRTGWSVGRRSSAWLTAVAQVALGRGRLDLSERLLRRSIALGPDAPLPYVRMVQVLLAKGETGAAVEMARRVRRDWPRHQGGADLLERALAADARARGRSWAGRLLRGLRGGGAAKGPS